MSPYHTRQSPQTRHHTIHTPMQEPMSVTYDQPNRRHRQNNRVIGVHRWKLLFSDVKDCLNYGSLRTSWHVFHREVLQESLPDPMEHCRLTLHVALIPRGTRNMKLRNSLENYGNQWTYLHAIKTRDRYNVHCTNGTSSAVFREARFSRK